MPISKEEHERRLKLYKQGWNDRQIGDQVNLSPDAIRWWRLKNKLKPQNYHKKLTKEDNKESLELYNKGLNDIEISKILNLTSSAIGYWRKVNNLKPNFNLTKNKISEDEHNKRLKLYNKKLSDKKIGDIVGKSSTTIRNWRKKHNLKSNIKYNSYKGKVSEDILIEAINIGVTTQKIAKLFDIQDTTVRRVMRKNNIKSWNFGKQCILCNKIFISNIRHQKRCSKCAEFKRDTYSDIKQMRMEFFRLMRKNPEEAMKIKEEMREEEGFGFMDYALDGICPEKVYETYGYTLLKENGGVLFEQNRKIKDINGKELTKQDIENLRESYFDKLYTIYQFVYGTRDGNDFIVYYINPFKCVEEIIRTKRRGYAKLRILQISKKIFKQHNDYVIKELHDKDGEFYGWHKRSELRKDIFKYFME